MEDQFFLAGLIIDAVCESGGVSYADFLYYKKCLRMNIIRGVASLLSWEYGVHARCMALVSKRSRSNIINQARRYRWYLHCNDAEITDFHDKAKLFIDKVLKQTDK